MGNRKQRKEPLRLMLMLSAEQKRSRVAFTFYKFCVLHVRLEKGALECPGLPLQARAPVRVNRLAWRIVPRPRIGRDFVLLLAKMNFADVDKVAARRFAIRDSRSAVFEATCPCLPWLAPFTISPRSSFTRFSRRRDTKRANKYD